MNVQSKTSEMFTRRNPPAEEWFHARTRQFRTLLHRLASYKFIHTGLIIAVPSDKPGSIRAGVTSRVKSLPN